MLVVLLVVWSSIVVAVPLVIPMKVLTKKEKKRPTRGKREWKTVAVTKKERPAVARKERSARKER